MNRPMEYRNDDTGVEALSETAAAKKRCVTDPTTVLPIGVALLLLA